MKKSAVLIVLVLIISSVFVGCEGGFLAITGEGDIVSQEFTLDNFTEVEAGGKFDIVVEQGDGQKVVIEGHQNIIDRLVLNVRGGVFESKLKRGKYRDIDLTIYITVPTIEAVELSGMGEILINQFDTLETLSLSVAGSGSIRNTTPLVINSLYFTIRGSGKVDFETSSINTYSEIVGSGDVELYGTTNNHEMTISGAGICSAFEFITKTTRIDVSGSGNCEVYADDLLDVEISGSGDVYYKGTPSINTDISGLGSLHNSN